MSHGYDISASISGQSRSEKALRFLAHEALRCRDRDTAEALCLLLPALLSELELKPMDQWEALEFHCQLREAVTTTKKRGPRHAMATAQTKTTYDEQKLPHHS